MEAFAPFWYHLLCVPKIVMGTKSLQVSGGGKKPFCGNKRKGQQKLSWDVSETETLIMNWVKEVDLITV